MSHCSQNVLSLWLRQRWRGRWVKHAQPARSTFHTLRSWGFTNRLQHQHRSCPLLGAAHAYWPGVPRAPGTCSFNAQSFSRKPASLELQLPASKHLKRLLFQSDLASEPPFASLGIAPGCDCSEPPSQFLCEAQEKVTPARISGGIFPLYSQISVARL